MNEKYWRSIAKYDKYWKKGSFASFVAASCHSGMYREPILSIISYQPLSIHIRLIFSR